MKKIIIIILFLVVLGVAIFFIWQHFSSIGMAKDSYSVIKETASSDEISQWLTYTNNTAKYSFEYPSGLKTDSMYGSNDRAVYFNDRNSKIFFSVFYQDTFDNQPVSISSYKQFKNEVNRRLTGLFAKGDKVTGHETSFQGKQAIIMADETSLGREIFVWQDNQVLQIEMPRRMNNEVLLSKILSTFKFIQ
ncbi:MAG: hypothetical protein WC608_02255 [Parcubacteria group bacterium]